MMRMRSLAACVALLLSVAAVADQSPITPAHLPVDPRPEGSGAVRIALLLDTSNSMDGLIDQAKRHLWSVVNTFAAARYGGAAPTLHVALFEYGNNGLPAHQGYIRCVSPMTTDLDVISQKLFELTTNGGSEHCGQVIDTAISTLDWGGPADASSYKAIFIAGNEPFTQGPVPYAQACSAASRKGVRVNTIHCGGYDQGIAGMWQQGAALTGGSYLNIDQDRVEPVIHTPYDDQLWKLNEQLNHTYLWYGQDGRAAALNQAAQDANARGMAPAAMAERARSKTSVFYRQAGRDLVDAYAEDGDALAAVPEAELPEAMKPMEPAQREAYVKQQVEARTKLQAQIQTLTQQREAFIDQEKAKQAEQAPADATLGEALIAAVRQQLAEQGWTFAE